MPVERVLPSLEHVEEGPSGWAHTEPQVRRPLMCAVASWSDNLRRCCHWNARAGCGLVEGIFKEGFSMEIPSSASADGRLQSLPLLAPLDESAVPPGSPQTAAHCVLDERGAMQGVLVKDLHGILANASSARHDAIGDAIIVSRRPTASGKRPSKVKSLSDETDLAAGRKDKDKDEDDPLTTADSWQPRCANKVTGSSPTVSKTAAGDATSGAPLNRVSCGDDEGGFSSQVLGSSCCSGDRHTVATGDVPRASSCDARPSAGSLSPMGLVESSVASGVANEAAAAVFAPAAAAHQRVVATAAGSTSAVSGMAAVAKRGPPPDPEKPVGEKERQLRYEAVIQTPPSAWPAANLLYAQIFARAALRSRNSLDSLTKRSSERKRCGARRKRRARNARGSSSARSYCRILCT